MIQIRPPASCPAAEIDAFEALVRSGGEVSVVGIRRRILNAAVLAFLYDDSGTLVGVSAVKQPYDDYRDGVFDTAGVPLPPDSVELGWVNVVPSHRGRGLSGLLVGRLMPHVGGSVYATTRSMPMMATLRKHGFRQIGVAFRSGRGDYDLSLFTR
jgi:GNAT superfamily N-acetyltransferase